MALPMDTCGDTLPPGTHGPGGRDNAFPSTCGSGSRGTWHRAVRGTGRPLGKTFFLRCQRRRPELPKIPTLPTFGNNQWDVHLLFAGIQLNNLKSNSLRLSPFEIEEGHTPHFPLDFPRMTSHAHEPSTVNDYMHRAERTFDSVRAMLAEER